VTAKIWIAAAGLLVTGAGTVAWACADGGEGTSWDAEASSAILSPGNDTRSNYILLMADRYGTKVADPAQMKKGIVPFDFSYRVMLDRLSPPPPDNDPDAAYRAYQQADAEHRAAYGIGENSYDYSELCHSNRSGAQEFEAAVNADAAISASDRASLLSQRQLLAKSCDKAAETRFALDEIRSPEGRAFAHYLEGTRLFYAGNMVEAAQQYRAIGRPSSPWLGEVASYMRFRVTLVDATNGSIGEYGEIADVAKRDRAAIDRADATRQAYLKAYPKGIYAQSARNLERRIAWLRGDAAVLGRAYSSMIARKAAAGSDPDTETMDEIDRRILPEGESAGVTDPTLLAIIDLMRLRPKTTEYHVDYEGPELNSAELERQRQYFQSQPELFGYLLAAEAYYHRKQPREVLALIPDASYQQRFGYVQFSRQMLRGFALEAVGDRNARGFWLSLLPGANQPYQREAVELAIYQHDQRAGAIGRLLETGSPILHPLIRQKMIEDDAGPDVLRQQATGGATKQQREVALYILLANELHHGRYREFLADQQMVGNRPQRKDGDSYGYGAWSVSDYDPSYVAELSPPPLDVFAAGGSNDLKACPDIRTTATSLAANPGADRPRLCLAEFIRRKGFDGWGTQYDEKLEREVVRGRNGFSGKPVERMEIYRAVMASPSASADDKAFALNRAIRCYQPSGYSSCGVEDVDKSVRKAWFDRLKSQYATSPWAKELKYYW
jgi:hypothetical protein